MSSPTSTRRLNPSDLPRRPRALALATLALATLVPGLSSGCGSNVVIEVDPDAGMMSPDAATTLNRTLVLETEPSLTLTSGTSSTLSLVLVDRFRVPVADTLVSFALEGRAHDSSLAAVEAQTNVQGRVSVDLLAGAEAASFRVRASAPEASPVFIEVTVSSQGLGDLAVSLGYEGERTLHTREIAVFTSATCSPEIIASRGDRTVVAGPDGGPTTIRGLPAEAPLAVVGRGIGSAGDVLATGCTDVDGIAANQSTAVGIDLADVAFEFPGLFGAALEISLGDALVASVEIPEPANEAEALFEDILATLEADGDTAAANALDRDRATHLVALAGALSETGPAAVVPAVIEAARDSQIELTGLLSLPTEDEDGEPTFQLRAVETRLSDGSRAPLETGMMSRPWEVAVEGNTLIVLAGSEIALGRSALLRGLVQAWRSFADSTPDGESLAAQLSGCATLELALEAETCDAECVQAACARVAEARLLELEDALSYDERATRLAVTGTLDGEDSDGNARIDELEGELEGTWAEGSAVLISFEAARSVPTAR